MFCCVAVLTFLAKSMIDNELCFVAGKKQLRGQQQGEGEGLELAVALVRMNTAMTSKSDNRARQEKKNHWLDSR